MSDNNTFILACLPKACSIGRKASLCLWQLGFKEQSTVVENVGKAGLDSVK